MRSRESHEHTLPKKQVHKSHDRTWQPNYLVNNSKHKQQEKYMQKTILARSWQDYPTARTQDVTPTNAGPPGPNSTSHLPKIEE